MRGILSGHHPSFERVLVIESGPPQLTESFLRHAYEVERCASLDVLTCYESAPERFDFARGRLISVNSAEVRSRRGKALLRISANRYNVVAIVCAGTPILRNWKLPIALFTRAKIAIINEHGDFFFLDARHRAAIQSMISHRLRLRGAMPFQMLGELLVYPFTVGYLLLYAGFIHGRRLLRGRWTGAQS